MRRRLLASMLTVAILAVTGFGLPLAFAVRELYREEAVSELSESAATTAVGIAGASPRDPGTLQLPDPENDEEAEEDIDIGLYRADGRKIAGAGPTRADAAVTETLETGSTEADDQALVVGLPITEDGKVVGAIRTSLPQSFVTHRTYRTWAAMASLGAIVLVVTGFLAARRSRSLAQPLQDLQADAEVIRAGGEMHARPGSGVAEIDAIQIALVRAATARNESLSRERALTADLAHQLATPLASLRLRVETEQASASPDEPRPSQPLLEDLLADVDRLDQTMADVLTLARDREPAPRSQSIEALLGEALDHWVPRFAADGRALDLHLEPGLPKVHSRPAAIRQILDVLIDNGLTHSSGAVHLSAFTVGPGAVIAVADEGSISIDADEVFVRRSPDASGSGIGLALARRLADTEDLRLIVADPGPGVVIHLVFGRIESLPR